MSDKLDFEKKLQNLDLQIAILKKSVVQNDPSKALVHVGEIKRILPEVSTDYIQEKLVSKGFDLLDIKEIKNLTSSYQTNVYSVVKWKDMGIDFNIQGIILEIKKKTGISFKALWDFFDGICEQDQNIFSKFFEICETEIRHTRFAQIALYRLTQQIKDQYKNNIAWFLEQYQYLDRKFKNEPGRPYSIEDFTVQDQVPKKDFNLPEIIKIKDGNSLRGERIG